MHVRSAEQQTSTTRGRQSSSPQSLNLNSDAGVVTLPTINKVVPPKDDQFRLEEAHFEERVVGKGAWD